MKTSVNSVSKKSVWINLREREVKKIFGFLRSGESCSIVGIGSVGKSNLLHLLEQSGVRQKYLGTQGKKYFFVYVDGNKKLENTDWGLFELIFHQLALAATRKGMSEPEVQSIQNLYAQGVIALAPSQKKLVSRFLDQAISILVNKLGLNVVLMIDEFDSICQSISAHAFSVLRGLRDEYKYRLIYVIATRTELMNLRQESTEIEAFYEIVTSNTITLLAYSKNDATTMLSNLAKRYDIALDQNTKDEILRLSGGHAALIRAIFDAYIEKTSLGLDSIAKHTRVLDECRRIWAALSRQQQTALIYVVSSSDTNAISPELQILLEEKGLLGGNWAGNTSVFSPVFERFIQQEQPTAGVYISVDRTHHVVWVNGRKFSNLPPLEFRLIDYLEQHLGQDCSRDHIAEFLYPNEVINAGEGVTDNRIDSIVKRVRKKIEINPENPHYILTIRGFGFRLGSGNEEF